MIWPHDLILQNGRSRQGYSKISMQFAMQVSSYYVFHGRVTLVFANNFLTQRRITMKFFTQFFLNPKVIFNSHTMFINAPTKEFTLRHLPSDFQHFTYTHPNEVLLRLGRLIRLWTKCL